MIAYFAKKQLTDIRKLPMCVINCQKVGRNPFKFIA